MRSRVESTPLIARWVLVGLVTVGCSNSDFLDGFKCTNDDQCGRGLPGSCEDGVCGGCPDELLSEAGVCECPGERIFHCSKLGQERCVSACPTAVELCEVAVLPFEPGEGLPRCEDADGEGCFDIELDPEECSSGFFIRLDGVPEDASIVVNCPPPESEDSDFECAPEEDDRRGEPAVEEPVCQGSASSDGADPSSLVCTAGDAPGA